MHAAYLPRHLCKYETYKNHTRTKQNIIGTKTETSEIPKARAKVKPCANTFHSNVCFRALISPCFIFFSYFDFFLVCSKCRISITMYGSASLKTLKKKPESKP